MTILDKLNFNFQCIIFDNNDLKNDNLIYSIMQHYLHKYYNTMKNQTTKTKLARKKVVSATSKKLFLDVSQNVNYGLSWSLYNSGICASCNDNYAGCLYKLAFNRYLCGFCYAVKYLNFADPDTINLYSSTLDQLSINNKTKEYYKLNNSVPSPDEIDPNVCQANISLIELVYLLKDPTTKQFIQKNNYKIFYNNNFPLGFLNSKIGKCFDDDADNDDNNDDNDDDNDNNDDFKNKSLNKINQNKQKIISKKQTMSPENIAYLKKAFTDKNDNL